MQARYLQIKTAILDSIEAGNMKPGDKVPSENQLTNTYAVSRMTARRALTELVEEGILLRSQGLCSAAPAGPAQPRHPPASPG